MNRQSVEELVQQIIDTCFPWVKPGEEGLLRFEDPIDGKEISAHYGATHAAAAFILYGEKSQNDVLTQTGYQLLDSVLQRWEQSVKLPGFHNDFNNFALCILWRYMNRDGKETICEQLKQTVLATSDSNNPTVNWLPMRWYVNRMRSEWTAEPQYTAICEQCRRDIASATYEDGFIDDRMPKGISFNLQYDVATVAVMQLLRCEGENINVSKELGALLQAVAPDGDINYLGRGTNQVFAWGLWIYLLTTSGQKAQANLALDYLACRLPAMLRNHNMMLNEWPGQQKYMWWDYHYCSVYTAHLLFWLVLTLLQDQVVPVEPKSVNTGASGMHIYRSADYFVCIFDGRKEYLTEKGPCIAALWTKSTGMLIKGTFGPWQGAFGRKYSPMDVVLRNYTGLMEIQQNRDFSSNRYVRKILPDLNVVAAETITPVFAPLSVKDVDGYLVLCWQTGDKATYLMNAALLLNPNAEITIDGKQQPLTENLRIRNQYGWISCMQTDVCSGTCWELRIAK